MAKKRRLKTPVKVIVSLLVVGLLGAGIYIAADHLKPGKAENELVMPDETEHALPIVLDEMREPEPEENNTQEEQQSEINGGEMNPSGQEETAVDETQASSAEETSETVDDQPIESGSEEQPGSQEQSGTETPPEPEDSGTIILPFDPAD